VKGLYEMDQYDNAILRDIARQLAELGVREDDEGPIRDVARQWALIVPPCPDSTPLPRSGEDH